MKIKKIPIQILLSLPLLIVANTTHAEQPDYEKIRPVLQSNVCLSCHQLDNKVVGPSYTDIANKYKDDPNNAEYLAKQIKQGSRGVWGSLPMPANSRMNDEDITIIVDWLMSGAPN